LLYQRLLRLQAENSQTALQQEDTLHRRRDEDLLVMQEESAVRREAARLASERALQEERLAHERTMLDQKLEAETEGRLRLEVWSHCDLSTLPLCLSPFPTTLCILV
jgi:ATPase family AAA domain-containing protein 3A/B